MSKKVKIKKKENDSIIYNSLYSKSLNRLLELSNKRSKNLKTKISSLKENKGYYISLSFIAIFISTLIPIMLMITTNRIPILAATIPLGLCIPSIPWAIIMEIKNKQKLILADNQLYTIETIQAYLKSELEISKEYNNLLSNSQILDKENKQKQQINDILNNNIPFNFIIDTYSEEYHKNLIILDSLKNLNDTQKELYLKRIYSQIDNGLFTKNDINISGSEELASIDNTSQKMLTTNNSLNETLQNQNKDSNTIQKEISLSKDDYTIHNFNELNSIFTYQQDEDILPPKAQEKGQQFSKKFPK